MAVLPTGSCSISATIHARWWSASARRAGAALHRAARHRVPSGTEWTDPTVEIPISKILLDGARQVSWNADTAWWGRGEFDRLSGPSTMVSGASARDLGALSGTVAGNVFEVFHYQSIPGNIRQVLSFVHSHATANHEIVVPFTDFRTDRRFVGGVGSGPINIPLKGIGRGQANPRPGELYRSDSLLVTMVPTFIGAPRFVETGIRRNREFRDFAYGISWIAHEAVHRWAAHLRFRDPQTGRIESLTEGCPTGADGCMRRRCMPWGWAIRVHPTPRPRSWAARSGWTTPTAPSPG